MNNISKSNIILYSKTPVFSFNYPNSIAKSRSFSFNL